MTIAVWSRWPVVDRRRAPRRPWDVVAKALALGIHQVVIGNRGGSSRGRSALARSRLSRETPLLSTTARRRGLGDGRAARFRVYGDVSPGFVGLEGFFVAINPSY
jgi:hypothetical protein